MFFFVAILFQFMSLCGSQQNNLPEPYRSIIILPFDPHGWFSKANREKLNEFLTTRNITTVIEVGSWLGSSATFMASLLPEHGKVYTVDHWLGNDNSNNHPDIARRLPSAYQQFLSNVIHKNVARKVIPIRMKSLEAAQALNVLADLIYIDANHEEKSVYNDIMAWYPKLKKGGIMCGDDYGFLGVRKAVKRASERLGGTFQVAGGMFWYFPSKKQPLFFACSAFEYDYS